jgi:mannonate dehydratase
MRLAIHGVRELTDEQAAFVTQLGIGHVNLNQYWPSVEGDVLTLADLRRLRGRVTARGLEVGALENIPVRFYDRIMLGLPGREEQLARVLETVRNIARAGIPVFGFNFMPSAVWRTNQPLDAAPSAPVDPRRATPELAEDQYGLPPVGRGGAGVSTFDYGLVREAPPVFGREIGEEEMWENFTWFIRALMPVAEAEGLRVALHPDDPVIPTLGGVARPFRSFEAFERAVEIAGSPLFGLTFCLGNWALMGEGAIGRAIERFGPEGRLHYLHFQAVRGTAERFEETFFDESPVFEPVLEALMDMRYDGLLVPAHAPLMGPGSGPFEDPWAQDRQGLCHAVGFLQGLIRGLERGRRA